MRVIILQLTPRDPIIARDGRPFGTGQCNRMRSLEWPLPSVVAGSFRTALVKASSKSDFSDDMPQRLMAVEVAGVFPVHAGTLYLPAPRDAVPEPAGGSGREVRAVHKATPQTQDGGGCDFPGGLPLKPVMLSEAQATTEFKPAEAPAWWPVEQMARWLVGEPVTFDDTFLRAAVQEIRDHVCLDAERGAAAEEQLFATAGLNVTHMPRFGVAQDDEKLARSRRFAEVTLSARVTTPAGDFDHVASLDAWHPLGGERRLVHWTCKGDAGLWACPDDTKKAMAGSGASQIRMVLATPAIFRDGWKPGWLNDQLEGSPPGASVRLRLVGVSVGRWKAVSGWSLAPPRGPKAIRRMTPAGSVYFFTTADRTASLADHWLKSVSDDEQERRDGFGLAVWGTW